MIALPCPAASTGPTVTTETETEAAGAEPAGEPGSQLLLGRQFARAHLRLEDVPGACRARFVIEGDSQELEVAPADGADTMPPLCGEEIQVNQWATSIS